jgi:aromatase
MQIEENILIRSSLYHTYKVFEDFKYWLKILPDVTSISILYQDSCQQEFLMTVIRPTGNEVIRGVRYYKPFQQIELFQPEPPPGFKKMVGVWTFHEVPGGIQVSAKRDYELIFDDQLNHTKVGENLRNYLRHNLMLFKDYLENEN